MPEAQADKVETESILEWLGRIYNTIGWLAAIGLLSALALARLVDGGPTPLAFLALLVQTFAFHAGLGITVVLLAAIAMRRWKLGFVLLLGVLVTVGPLGLRSIRSVAPPIDDAQTLTVISCNLGYDQANPNRLIAWIDEVDPDVIVLQEYGTRWAEIVRTRLRDRYPHMVEEPRPDAFGQATLSRMPLSQHLRNVWPGYWDIPSIRATLEFEGLLVDVTNVHVYPPISFAWFEMQREQIWKLRLDARSRLGETDYSSRRRDVAGTILIGDFNGPWRTGQLRPLRQETLHGYEILWEAHDKISRSRGATWGPTRRPLSLAPGIRLDHAVYGGDLEPVFSVVGPDVGSDHRPIAAGFRWRIDSP
ncbi:MAG: endonuclease/exonuclease/phosphatase family protein [Phycisphaerales bacterium]